MQDRIKRWLKEADISRKELAKRMGVALSTVDGWLLKKNPRPIPLRKQLALEELMRPTADPGCVAVNFSFSASEWAEITSGLPEGVNKSESVKKRLLAFIRAARMQ